MTLNRRTTLTRRTPSYGEIARQARRAITRPAHGPLGIAVPETDHLDVVKWRGPVERRDPASYRTRSVHETWRCPSCRSWTMNGAYLLGLCNWCFTPRPAS